MSISAVVITLDEEHNIEACLESLRFCDEVVVLDSGSRDATVERASRIADRVETRAFRDFADQKNHAASLASGDWLLSLDADERVGPKLRDEIVRATEGAEVGFWMPRLSNFFGHWLYHGGFHPDRQLRLWRRGTGRWVGRVHERVKVDGEVGELANPILHYPYANLEEWVAAINRYSTLSARSLAADGTRPSLRRALTTPVAHFAERVVWRSGWRDGAPGVIAATVTAFDGFLAHAKHWTLASPRRRSARGSEAPVDAS